MEDHSITGLVDSCTSLPKLYMIFNTSPCASVGTIMHQQNLLYLLERMAWNISFTTHRNLSCTHERKFTKLIKSHTNVSSKQGIKKSTKTRNTPTSPIHIVMYIIPEISLTDAQSYKNFISSMVTSQTGDPINNLIPLEEFTMQKQDQYKQEF